LLSFYFISDRTGRTLEDVRRMPAGEFFSWLNFHGFAAALDRSKKG
jgi:hypothetical protein